MLARTALLAPQPQCCANLLLRPGRVLVVPRASYSARSSSPRSETWRSSWRDELQHDTNGNGNGVHSGSNDEQYGTYNNNGNGYHSHDTDQGDDNATWGNTNWRSQAAAVDDNGVTGAEDDVPTDEASEGGSSGFFSNAFKDALQGALKRSPLYADEYAGSVSGSEENLEPEPYESEVEVFNRPIFTDSFRSALKESLVRQQAELDTYGGYASDDEPPPTATAYISPPPQRREMSPIEEIISTALGASQHHLRRLNMMKNEIEAAIERETKQVERLDFAMKKTESDLAYYKTLERLLEERKGK